MGEVFNYASILDMVLEGFVGEYRQIKYSAEADDDFTLDRAVMTMRDMYANKLMRNGSSRHANRREPAMVLTSTPSAVVTCSHCQKTVHRFESCFKRKGTMSGKTLPKHLKNDRGVA